MKVSINLKTQDYPEWLNNVPEKVQVDVDRHIPTIARGAKQQVRTRLFSGHGVDQGVYKRSFMINNFAESKWQVGFQVFAKKPHYRLTHLLEGYDNRPGGHKIVMFTRGRGTRTKWGNIGMSWVKTKKRPNGYTLKFKHIEEGQKYAEEEIINRYERSLNSVFSERMKKIK